MKKTILIITALFVFMSLRLDAKPGFGISFNFFYSSLRPYGEWIQLDNDLVVWRPSGIRHSWRPYSHGRWSWTSEGWYWDSYEPFGWATYHYGRWYDDDYYGWIWIPDYQWGPSWVEWRYDDDYIGWAPLPPYASFHIDLGIHFSIRWHSHYNCWNFVSYHRFYDRRVYNYYLDDVRSERIFERTKYRTNYYSDRDRIVNRGVDRSFIERKGGYRISERSITPVDNYRDFERSRDGRSDRVIAYRPSEREVDNGRTIEKYDIKRGENRSSLEREKIRTQLTPDDRRVINSGRTNNREREINVERDTKIDKGRIREESLRDQAADKVRKDSERDRIRIDSENRRIERRETERSERKTDERLDRQETRERQPMYERPSRSEMPVQTEQRVESRRESNYERPTPKTERWNEKSSGKSERKEEGRSSDRRR